MEEESRGQRVRVEATMEPETKHLPRERSLVGANITRALAQMSNSEVVLEFVDNIEKTLLQADVDCELVRMLRDNMLKVVNLPNTDSLPISTKRRRIKQAIFQEMCQMLDAGEPPFTPKKGERNVVIFVGLAGSGKTTTCTKYALFHQLKGFKAAVVCADTYREGAVDQLKQDAVKATIPFYGSEMESDPVKLALKGVESLTKKGNDLIIVDTCAFQEQKSSEFDQMHKELKPNLVVLVIDCSIGQAASAQANAFKSIFASGAVILTKLDGHAKGGGAFSAVVATKSHIIFAGTGQHIEQFKVFDAKQLVARLLGFGMRDNVEEVPAEQQIDLQNLYGIPFTLRSYNELCKSAIKMGSEIFTSIPGYDNDMVPKQDQIDLFITIMKSMTRQELGSPEILNNSRILRIAKGSGRKEVDVSEMLDYYEYTRDRIQQLGGGA